MDDLRKESSLYAKLFLDLATQPETSLIIRSVRGFMNIGGTRVIQACQLMVSIILVHM